MAERGKPWGINFSYGGSLRNTLDSHRLLEKAYRQGGEPQQRTLLERLFHGYFENEQDPGDRDWLAAEGAASALGSKEEVRAFLDSDELKAEVQADVKRASRSGIDGVPFVIIDGKYAVSGAQEPETFVEIFKKIANDELVD